MDRFIFRVMAEADLEKFTKTMAEGGAIDLPQLKELIERECVEESSNDSMIRQAVSDYLAKLLELLPSAPRPSLMSELLRLTQLIGQALPGSDLWESQNRWHQLWHDPNYAGKLSPNELALFIRVGENLGFGLGAF
jgi:hypothetical protein